MSLALSVSGCSSTAHVEPGPFAADPLCAQVIRSLDGTDSLGADTSGNANSDGEKAIRREVDSQSTAAWGDPPIIMRCGVPVPGPTAEGCIGVNGVDWIGPRDPQANDRRYVTYKRSPAVEVYVPVGSLVPIDVALTIIGSAVKQLPTSGQCS